MTTFTHVVAAVLEDAAGRVLLARRPDHLRHGGLWEFPGGKVEPEESPYAALVRELEEELGVRVGSAEPLIRIPYPYECGPVLLDVWRVGAFAGEPVAQEGQRLEWAAREALAGYAYPEANRGVVAALRLPSHYLITPEPGPEPRWPTFLEALDAALADGIRLVQLRAKALAGSELDRLAGAVVERCRRAGARVLVNGPPELAERTGADGLHLSGSRLRGLRRRPLGADRWLAASCHDAEELALACRLPVDFAVVSPVRPTPSHPGAPVLGWDGFRALTDSSTVPVYALGGVGPADVDHVRACGGQGIAAIRALWPERPAGGPDAG